MKDHIKWIVIIVGFLLFATLMWGLFFLAVGGRFVQGIMNWIILIGVWGACTVVVWVVTKIPVFPHLELSDCAKYAAILSVGSAVIHIIIESLHTKLPNWSGWIIGVIISIWACTVEYRREKK